jgi:hypothetical protein
MNNSLDKLIGNDELLTYICLILAILNTLLMSMVINDTNCNFSIYIFLLFEALFLIFIVYFILKKKDVYGKDDDIKYDWYFYLRVSIIILVFFNFALYIYDITNDSSINPKKTGGVGNSIFGSIKNMYYKLRDKETYFTNKLQDIRNIKQQIFNNNNRLTKSITEQQRHFNAYNNAIKIKQLNDTLLQNLNDSNEKLTRISNEIAKFNEKHPTLKKLDEEEKIIKKELAKIKERKSTSSTARRESSNRIHPIEQRDVNELTLQELKELNNEITSKKTYMSSNPLPPVRESELKEL